MWDQTLNCLGQVRRWTATAAVVAVLCALAVPAFGAIALVDKSVAASANTNNVTVPAINSTGANLLTFEVADYQVGAVGTVSDSKGNTWALCGVAWTISGGAAPSRVAIFHAKNATVGSGHTATYSGTGIYPAASLAAWSGADTTAPCDQSTGTSSAATSSLATGTITPLATGELWVSATSMPGSMIAPTTGTLLNTVAGVGGVNFGVAVSYKIQTTIATEQETWTYPGTPEVAVVIASFKAATVSPMTITPTAIPKNHGGNITLTLTGIGTSWVNGTSVFTPSGVTGVTKISQNVTSSTAATAVITTDATHTGTLIITESVTGSSSATTTINTATIGISPTFGATGTTPTLTITGASTVWTQETLAGLFAVGGGSGASIGTPTCSTNTGCTATLTTGSSAGTLTVTDTSTGATAAFAASSPPTISSVAYTNLSAFSAVFTWSTGAVKADSQVLCGASGGSSGTYATYSTQVSDPVQIGTSDYWGVTSHRIGINLPASYSGHCIVQSISQGGLTGTSADQVVTTPAAPVNVPIGVSFVSPRVNLTNGAAGYSGDIDLMAATADGQWIMQNNDSNGKAISSSQYCCDGHLLLSKWPDMFTRTMLLGQDSSTPGARINNPFGMQAEGAVAPQPYSTITSGTCAANVATINFQNRGYTIPVGTPVWVAGASPAGYIVSNVAITGSTATSVTYPGTCGSSAWTSGGQVSVWNDGNQQHFLSFGIDSVNGLVCLGVGREPNESAMYQICSTDYFAHSFNNSHNAPGGPTTVVNLDVPLPSTPCFFTACYLNFLYPLQPCRDYGGASENTFPCTWIGGTENYIYATCQISPPQSAFGYRLCRHPYADHARVDGTTWQIYTCAQADDDRGLYNNCWSSTLTLGTVLNSAIATLGNSFSIVTAPDFNGFIAANWAALGGGSIPAGNISQSAGAALYDLGMWPWGTATAIGSVNRDETDITRFFPTWSFIVPASYATVSSSAPIRATVQLRQSGSYVGTDSSPAVNKYGPNLYTIGLAKRETTAKGNAGPTFSYSGGAHGSFVANGLDLFYAFQDPTGTRTVTNASPSDTLGTYSTTLAQTKTALYDRYGLFSTGFPVDGLYGNPGIHGYNFFITTPYVVQNTDFTLAVVFNHQDTASSGPPSGECVINRTSLKICRNTTTANSWLVTVGSTTSSGLAVTCDGAFCGIVIDRVGSSAKVYKTNGIQPNTLPLTALATISDGTTLASDALIVGAKADGTLQFQGWVSALAYYNRGLSDNELQQFVGALRSFEAGRGIALP